MMGLNFQKHYADINGLPQDGESGNPGELDFVKRTWVGILTSTMIPRVGKIDLTAILKSWEDLGMSDKCSTILENIQSFPLPRMAERKDRCYTKMFLNAHQFSVFKGDSVLTLSLPRGLPLTSKIVWR